MNETRELPMQCREARFEPATLATGESGETTVDLVWTTGARVRRMDFWTGRKYDEELSLDPASVDLSRLNGGAPLLNTHRAGDTTDVIGVVERAWLEGNEGRATVRFSARPEIASTVADVKSGILRNISVGYAVRKYQIEEGDVPVYRAVDWIPMELSIVPIPADAGAGFRSADQRTTSCEFQYRAAAHNQETVMSQETTPAVTHDLDAIRAEAALAERSRVSEITVLCQRHGMTDAADKLVSGGVTVEAARAQILDALATRDAGRNTPHIVTMVDETDTRRDAVENAIMNRAAPGQVKLTDAGRQYRGMSLLEIGRQLIEKEGVSTRGMDKLQLAQRALSTSDFPAVLANVANKTLRAGYEAAPQTFKPFTKQTSAPDFKTIQRTQLGDAPQLKKVNEAGEFTYGAISDGKETYSLATYGRIIAVTRQTLINDDLAAFADLPAKFGRAAANLESDIVWGIITTNAALADGVALFHATHGNLGSGAIAVAGLNSMRGAMRIQKSLDGQFINVMPSYLIVPAALETTAQQYTSADFVSAKSSDINPFKSALQVLVEPRLDASSTAVWYGAADPMTIDTIEYCYLDGNEGVYIETRNGFEVDGMEIKARLDFAAKAIDFRGLFKSTGV
jgi:phage major head subunit gpT-like protein